MKKINNKGFGVVVILFAVALVGLIAGVGYFVYNSQNKITSKESNVNTESKSVVNPDMNFVKPAGWSAQEVNTSKNTVKTYTSPDGSGAKIVLIMQEGATRTGGDDLVAIDKPKEIELKSALFGDQYIAKYNDVSNTVTSFNLRVYFDVLMEEEYYNQQKYQQVYHAFLDSFVPNGTTNNQ